jgi:hypothetical protein
MMRRLAIAALGCALLLTVPASAREQVPTLPDSTHGAKRCGKTHNQYAKYRVFVTKGKSRISCRRARKIARTGVNPPKRYQYFDWTKGGNGPWSDVWWRHDHKVVIAGILYGY